MKQDVTNYNLFIDAIETLGECMDDYIFFSDLNKDFFSTTEAAAKKFAMPSKTFNNASKVFASFVHPDDYPTIITQITEIRSGVTDEAFSECRWYDAMGNPVWVSCRSHLIKGKNGNPDIVVGTISELGQKRRADNITGFRGMERFIERLKESTSKGGYIMRLFVRNIYGLIVNHGEENINHMLGFISNAIRDNLSSEQECFYHSRGVFMIFSETGNENDAFALFKQINDSAMATNDKLDYRYGFKLRCGAVTCDSYDSEPENTIKKCEFSATHARKLKSRSFYTFNEQDYDEYNRSRELISTLQFAVKNDFKGFDVYYQPILYADTKKLFACEALLRYSDENFGTVSPDVFVPLLEESGLIIPVGRWVLHHALDRCKKWQDIFPDMHISVNLSYIQLERDDIMQELISIIKKSELNNKNLVLEFTESGNILSDVTKDYAKIMSECNINLALDDFGMGYSNLLYLNELKVDYIKIDRTFVESSNSNEYCYDLIRHIVEIAHSIDVKVCIEGIETKEELEHISKLGPDFYQGFYFNRPIPPEEFEEKYL